MRHCAAMAHQGNLCVNDSVPHGLSEVAGIFFAPEVQACSVPNQAAMRFSFSFAQSAAEGTRWHPSLSPRLQDTDAVARSSIKRQEVQGVGLDGPSDAVAVLWLQLALWRNQEDSHESSCIDSSAPKSLPHKVPGLDFAVVKSIARCASSICSAGGRASGLLSRC